ncbi:MULTISPECIES: response regulator transcription factor [Pseudomonas]|jgi:two-component system response regulator EvgA|uniref:Response regulator transcription factor n=1 Tax=Pseudomonas soli TaxID=1306993 RepID=A0A1H9TBQ8_9PSED|nr:MULTISPECIES: response regulator transcription factor [Pseudomonas]AIN59879.1 LuxR family transcriptional regulator [Pseudomonas soli]AUY36086.1 DNA-binding response regulator [Pseudomonas sp. PONIH3]MCX5510172.1 response regulator transcription factor [Pseudomonas sp. BJa3]MDT3716420.1 response regulator transcription factor [Pseudomonas soli]MDT3732941.1 response regulator transcription factor [Pseudomonas soli]
MNKVLIVDDHPVIRLAVRMLMERHGYEVVAESDNGVDALQLTREYLPDIVILDIGIPKLDGLEVIARMTLASPASKVLVLTSQAPGHFSMRCMQAGAAGYVCKQQELTELLSAIKAVLSGYSYFPNQALHKGRSGTGGATEMEMVERLSGREMMVLQQLARGKSNKEIADSMFLSNKTVSTYKTRLLLKLNARSLVDLIELAQRHGLA